MKKSSPPWMAIFLVKSFIKNTFKLGLVYRKTYFCSIIKNQNEKISFIVYHCSICNVLL